MPVISVLWRLSQGDQESEASLSYTGHTEPAAATKIPLTSMHATPKITIQATFHFGLLVNISSLWIPEFWLPLYIIITTSEFVSCVKELSTSK